MTGALLAISDIHVSHDDNRKRLTGLLPGGDDWLIVAGDVAEYAGDVLDALEQLRERYAQVIWVPGNHELWTHPHDPCTLRGVERYEHLVDGARRRGVLTPEDDYPVFDSAAGPLRIAPLMTLYDHSFRPADGAEPIPLTDEALLHTDPHPTIADWCRSRTAHTRRRLEDVADPSVPFVLVNHYPLVQAPVDAVHLQGIAPWCGTRLTERWHLELPVTAMVYGHLHIRRSTRHSGVRFEEVSLGYPREWRMRPHPSGPVTIAHGAHAGPAPGGAVGDPPRPAREPHAGLYGGSQHVP